MKASRLLACFAALCFCVAAVLCLGSQASAQSTTDGAIGGTVIDSSGSAVPKATVTLKNVGTNFTRVIQSDAEGRSRDLPRPDRDGGRPSGERTHDVRAAGTRCDRYVAPHVLGCPVI